MRKTTRLGTSPESGAMRCNDDRRTIGPIILNVLTINESDVSKKMNTYITRLGEIFDSLFYGDGKVFDITTGREITDEELQELFDEVKIFLRPFETKVDDRQTRICTSRLSDKAKKLNEEEYEMLISLQEEYAKCLDIYQEYKNPLAVGPLDHSEMTFRSLQRKYKEEQE